MKKTNLLVFAVAVMFLMAVSVGFAAEKFEIPEKITIDIVKEKKPAVVFPHKAHIDRGTPCIKCHHKREGDAKPRKCEECHDKTKDEGKKIAIKGNPPTSSKKGIFHVRCISCHREQRAKNPSTKAPTVCTKCHKK
ncbi:MAG: hypothetical protein D6734_08545 [Candidatus Schekmanbacteria bacterium]|nr:MAG: hypothetical protein D6734_08545 [Candidatus Schekmanbacteria bacterium]